MVLIISFSIIDGTGDFWYNEYGIINMGGSQNAIKKTVDIMGFECSQQ